MTNGIGENAPHFEFETLLKIESMEASVADFKTLPYESPRSSVK